MTEWLDACEEWGAPVGRFTRAEVHRRGLWHHCFHLWIVRDGEVLLQRRASAKASFPDMLDATAAGHLTAGEQVRDGLREVEEELGVRYAFDQLEPLGVRTCVDRPTPTTLNREFQHLFLVEDARPLESFTRLQVEEVAGLVALPLGSFQEFACVPDAPGPWGAREWDGAAVRAVSVRREEIVPGSYLAPLSVACERLLAGQRPLAV